MYTRTRKFLAKVAEAAMRVAKLLYIVIFTSLW